MFTRVETYYIIIAFVSMTIFNVFPAESGDFPAIAMGDKSSARNASSSKVNPFQVKRDLKELQKAVKELNASGKDPTPVMLIMIQIPPLMKQGKTEESAKLIDDAFRKVEAIKSGREAPDSEQPAQSEETGPYEKVMIIGDDVKKGGIGDPSLEYGPDGTGWLTYTFIDLPYLATHLAKSTNRGKTWKFVQVINKPFHDKIVDERGSKVDGIWEHETSSLVYDPDDPGKEWKLFWLRYFRTKDEYPGTGKAEAVFSRGWIAYRYSSNPEGEWSEEIPLFGMGQYTDRGTNLSRSHSDLKYVLLYYELGSIYTDGVIYLSVDVSATSSSKGEWEKRKIVLLASRDHGKTWEYVGTLTDSDDAKKFGYLIFTASSIVKEKGRIFLFVSPSGKLSNLRDPEGFHDGIHIFEFEDITKARLKRDNKGKLILVKHIDDPLEKGGQGDYDEQNTYGGIVIPQEDLKYYPKIFQIFSTKEKIVN